MADIIEIGGLERARRLKGGRFSVTAKSLVAAQKSQADATFGSFRPPELVVKKTAPQKLDKNGRPPEAVWSAGVLVDGPAGDKFRLAHDGTYLYYAYTCKRNGPPMKNGGKDPTTYFETGGAFDLMLQTSSNAKPDRREGAKGDIRLLFAQVGGKVVCVKYDYVGAKSAKNARISKKNNSKGGTAPCNSSAIPNARPARRRRSGWTQTASPTTSATSRTTSPRLTS